MIELKHLDKAEVLAALFNSSKAQGMDFLHYKPEPMTKKRAQQILDKSGPIKYFDYLEGRVMKIDLSGNQLDTRLYDRDNGEGAADTAISTLTEKKRG